MPKCKYSEINPLNDTYTCTKSEAKYGTRACHDPLLCPAAEFEVEDLKKARVYLNWLIESAEKENS